MVEFQDVQSPLLCHWRHHSFGTTTWDNQNFAIQLNFTVWFSKTAAVFLSQRVCQCLTLTWSTQQDRHTLGWIHFFHCCARARFLLWWLSVSAQAEVSGELLTCFMRFILLDFFQLMCGLFAIHCLVTDTTCIWGCLQCPLCSSWKAEHFSGDVNSVQEAATYFSLLVFIAVLFFYLFISPSLFHSQTLHSFLEHCWTQLEPPHKATPPLCHRVPTGVCVHLWLLKLEVCITEKGL